MKRFVKFVVVCSVVLAIFAAAAFSAAAQELDKVKIGILQFAPHASLDNCYEGILQGLENKGFVDGISAEIDFVNGMGEIETNNLAAAGFVSKKYDMIIAIATPSAVAAYAAARDAGIPVVFSAVSDPVAAGLVKALDFPDTGATGTSDALNFEGQLKMIRAFVPKAKTIGVLYTTSEANSVSQLEKLTELAKDFDFEVKAVGITDASEVALGAAQLVAEKVDVMNNLTDNNVVNNFSVVTNATDPAGIPIFGSEIEQVAQYGCVAAESLDYVALGVTTGEMAGDILKGEPVETMPVVIVKDSKPVYNADVMAKFGIALPSEYAEAADVAGAR